MEECGVRLPVGPQNHRAEFAVLRDNDFAEPTGSRKTEAGHPRARGSPSQGHGIFRATARKISLTDSRW